MPKTRKPGTVRTPPEPSDSHAEIERWMRSVMPDLQPVVEGLDALIRGTIPGLQYAIKWKKAYYGLPDQGWIIEVVAYDVSVNIVFLGGADFTSPPPLGDSDRSRYVKITSLEQVQRADMREWIQQAPRVPGWRPAHALPTRLGDVSTPLDVAKELYAALDADDVARVAALCDDDVEVLYPAAGALSYGGSWRGREGVLRFLDTHEATEEILDFGVSTLVADGDTVLARGHFRGRVRATGREWSTDFVHVLLVTAGRLTRWQAFFDTAAAVAART
jgi:ketosteroid isomerase-like protein